MLLESEIRSIVARYVENLDNIGTLYEFVKEQKTISQEQELHLNLVHASG